MRKTLIIIASIFFIASCTNQTGNDEASADNTEMKEVNVLTLEEFFASPEKYLEQEIIIQGMVTHVCKHGGQKLFIATQDNPENLRINTSENIPEFSLDLEGSTINFTGILTQMDEESIENAIAEEKEHHGEEAENCEETGSRNMNFHLVAQSFEIVD